MSSEQKNSEAEFNMGVMYGTGKGVAVDYQEALRWYTKAARQGHGKAQTNLGVMYGTGKGVPQNNVMAYMWLEIGSAQGISNAKKAKEIVASRMRRLQLLEAQNLVQSCVKKKYKNC